MIAPHRAAFQVPLDPVHGLSAKVTWSKGITGPAVPPPAMGQATNAVAVMRGPLLYSLYLEEQCTGVVKTWLPFNNTDVNLVTHSEWKCVDRRPVELCAMH